MSEIVWEDPSDECRGRPPLKWMPILLAVQERPGEWARIAVCSSPTSAHNTATNIKRSCRIPAGKWELKSRKAEDGQGYVYARYLGPDAPELRAVGQ